MFDEHRVWNPTYMRTVELQVNHIDGLGSMRQALGAWLEATGVGEDPGADVVLAIHEAVVNALEHSGGTQPVVVRGTRLDGLVAVEVLDSGSWKAPELPAPEGRGRGLALIRDLVTNAEIITRTDGTTVRLCRTA